MQSGRGTWGIHDASVMKLDFPDDGGSKFLRHSDTLLPSYTASRPIKQQFLNPSQVNHFFPPFRSNSVLTVDQFHVTEDSNVISVLLKVSPISEHQERCGVKYCSTVHIVFSILFVCKVTTWIRTKPQCWWTRTGSVGIATMLQAVRTRMARRSPETSGPTLCLTKPSSQWVSGTFFLRGKARNA